jgi:hypothetical protein
LRETLAHSDYVVAKKPSEMREPRHLTHWWLWASFGRRRCGSVLVDRTTYRTCTPPGADTWTVDAQGLVDAFGEGGCGVFSLFQGAAGDEFGEGLGSGPVNAGEYSAQVVAEFIFIIGHDMQHVGVLTSGQSNVGLLPGPRVSQECVPLFP